MKLREILSESEKIKYTELLIHLSADDGPDDTIDASSVKSLTDIDFTGITPELGLMINDNGDIKNLVGGPKILKGTLFIENCNNFESLSGSIEEVYPHEHYIGAVSIVNCQKLTSLKDIHKSFKTIHGEMEFIGTPIKSHVLGLLKIKGLTRVNFDNEPVTNVINKYLPEGDIFNCQDELIDAGFKEYAKL